jgi:hypothetical protein
MLIHFAFCGRPLASATNLLDYTIPPSAYPRRILILIDAALSS